MIELSLAASLLDRLIALFKEGHARDRKLYEDFVVPFMRDMDRLHQDYLESFARYRSAVQTAVSPLNADHSLIHDLERDAVFTEHLRSRVRVMLPYGQDPVFGGLARDAQSYLFEYEAATFTLVNGDLISRNVPRTETAHGLKAIFSSDASDEQKRAEALELINWMVGDLQKRYGAFIRSASEARRKLLDKRLGTGPDAA
jgi:hypothetical protein